MSQAQSALPRRAAIELKDERRTILFGERVLAREKDDTQILERVARALLNAADKALYCAKQTRNQVVLYDPSTMKQGNYKSDDVR